MLPLTAQPSGNESGLLHKLDSASKASAPAKYFASIYFTTTEKAVRYYAGDHVTGRKLINRFEDNFAGLYFRSAAEYFSNSPVEDPWKNYYADSMARPVKYKLYGINAHINGDIWKALRQSFSLDELKTVRKDYLSFYRGLLLEYKEFYRQAYLESRTLRHLHLLTLGVDKIYGRILLKRWRKRQMRLALCSYTDKNKFESRLTRVNRKKDRIDRLILHHI
jgi:hypothetical protein